MASSENRLCSLDLLRGLDIFSLTALTPFVAWNLLPAWTSAPAWLKAQFTHALTMFADGGASTTGFGLFDFAQPCFIFITGAAAALSIPKRLDAEGRPTAAFWMHVLGRVALLWGLGCLIRGALTFDLAKFSPYADTLQTIAVAYLGGALSLLIRRKGVRLALPLVLLAAYGVIQATCGDYTRLGNVSRMIDERVFGAIGCRAKDFCYVLTTVAWASMGMLGAGIGRILKGTDAPWRKVRLLAGWGAASLVLGWILQIWIPANRFIYTVSFVFTTLGYAILLLDLLYVVTDIWRFRRGTGLFLLFGQCSLAAWMLYANPLSSGLAAISKNLVVGVPKLVGTNAYFNVYASFVQSVLLVIAVALWHRYKTARRSAK